MLFIQICFGKSLLLEYFGKVHLKTKLTFVLGVKMYSGLYLNGVYDTTTQGP